MSSGRRQTSESDRYLQYNWQKNPEFTPDRGAGYYQRQRRRLGKASLVESGKHAGRSRVAYYGGSYLKFLQHLWFRDFFTSVVTVKISWIILSMVLVYFLMFVIFGVFYMILDLIQDSCFDNDVFQDKFVNYYIFSMVTQQTIGYGVRAPKMCWSAAILITIHSVFAMLVDSIFLGIIFARISNPRRRGRSIFLSDCAVIAYRDGILKFMFRLADVRPNTVMSPIIKCHMYSFGHGRKTAEGEFIPVQVQELLISNVDGNMLLPVTVEHTIDERSPLFGHSRESLERQGTEIVVTFEGTNEFGDTFSARQSYLPSEIHWGFTFHQTIYPSGGNNSSQHAVDLTKFHEVEPQELIMNKAGTAQDTSLRLIHPSSAHGKIPTSLLGENTLVLSDYLCVTRRNNELFLTGRVGDSYSHQFTEAHVRAYIYRWNHVVTNEGEIADMQMEEILLEPSTLFLKYPCFIQHKINDESPLFKWQNHQNLAYDATSEIVLVVEGVQLLSSCNLIKQKTYKVSSQVRYGYAFKPMIIPPQRTVLGTAVVEWEKFHQLERQQSSRESSQLETSTSSIISQDNLSGEPQVFFPFFNSRYQNYGMISHDEVQKEQERILSWQRGVSNLDLVQSEVQAVESRGVSGHFLQHLGDDFRKLSFCQGSVATSSNQHYQPVDGAIEKTDNIYQTK